MIHMIHAIVTKVLIIVTKVLIIGMIALLLTKKTDLALDRPRDHHSPMPGVGRISAATGPGW
jgi:hypothetical protein